MENIGDQVPVDYVSNAILGISFAMAKQNKVRCVDTDVELPQRHLHSILAPLVLHLQFLDFTVGDLPRWYECHKPAYVGDVRRVCDPIL
jgi:hypothetical protein